MTIQTTYDRFTSFRDALASFAKQTTPIISVKINYRDINLKKIDLKGQWSLLVGLSLLFALPPLLYVWRPLVGVYTDVLALAIFIAIGSLSKRLRQLAISAAILPISSMIMASMPKLSPFIETTVYYLAILLFAIVYRYLFTLDVPPKKKTALGQKYMYTIPAMIVVGEVLGGLGYLFLRHQYRFQGESLVIVSISAIVFAMAEAMLFQGLIQQLAQRILSRRLAAVLAVIAYTVTAIGFTTPLTAIFALISGIILSLTYYFKQNLILVTAANALMKLTYIGLIATFVLR